METAAREASDKASEEAKVEVAREASYKAKAEALDDLNTTRLDLEVA